MADDAIAVLEAAHRELKDLFAKVSSPDEDRPAVLKELMQTMTLHLNMEKELLLPVLRDEVDGGASLADDILADHDRAEKTLTLLERRKVNSPDVPELVTDLLDINDHHVAEADEDVLPALRAALSGEALADLGARMSSGDHAVLTHSHPSLPDSGPLAGVAHKAAEIVDRVRDATTDVGRTNS